MKTVGEVCLNVSPRNGQNAQNLNREFKMADFDVNSATTWGLCDENSDF